MDPSDGGPPMALSRLAAAQVEKGAQVCIAALTPLTDQVQVNAAYQSIPAFSHVRINYLPIGNVFERLLATESKSQLTQLISQNDILHVHGIWRPHLLQAARIARKLGRPYLVSPHGMLSVWSLSQKRLKKQLAMRLGWRTALEHAHFLHVLNQDEKQAVMAVCAPRAVIVLPNGISLDEFVPRHDWENSWNKFARLHAKRFIVFVGRLHESKGLDILAEAFAHVVREGMDVDLVVIGPEFGAGTSFRQAIRRLGIESHVHMLGGLYGPEKLAILSRASCFCLPSRQEGFSMAIIEAMALGLPVVISDMCHFPEAATEEAGQVVRLDPRAVADAIVRLLTDEAFSAQQSRRAQQLVASRFQWKFIAREFVKVYGAISNAHVREEAVLSQTIIRA
jgi:glycosyltransferase involved in cell wall biosynthesis